MNNEPIIITSIPVVVENDGNYEATFCIEGNVSKHDILWLTKKVFVKNEVKPRNIVFTSVYVLSVDKGSIKVANIRNGTNLCGMIQRRDKLFKQIFSGDYE